MGAIKCGTHFLQCATCLCAVKETLTEGEGNTDGNQHQGSESGGLPAASDQSRLIITAALTSGLCPRRGTEGEKTQRGEPNQILKRVATEPGKPGVFLLG